MKRIPKILHAWLLVMLGLLGFAILFALALCIRIVYETVMLPVHVWRAERDGALDEPGMVSWPEHLVREDRETVEIMPVHPHASDLGAV